MYHFLSLAWPFSTVHHFLTFITACLARKTSGFFGKYQVSQQASTQILVKRQRPQQLQQMGQGELLLVWRAAPTSCTQRSQSSANWLSRTQHPLSRHFFASQWLAGHRWTLKVSSSTSQVPLYPPLDCKVSPHRESCSRPSDLSP